MLRSLLLSLSLVSGAVCIAQTHNAEFVEYVGLRYVCEGEVVPVVRILNAGTETMTGCVVDTWKNGVMVDSFNWILAVAAAPGQTRTPVLPALPVVEGDELEFHIISVNGVTDQVSAGNILEVTMNMTPVEAPSPTMRVEVLTDDHPEEVSWTIRNAGYQVVASGGPYTEANTAHAVWLTVDADDCFAFEVNDTGGDGFTNGHVRLYSLGSEVFGVGSAVPFFRVNAGLITGTTVGVAEEQAPLGVVPYPSPSSGVVMLRTQGGNGSLRVGVLDASGRMVHAVRTNTQAGAITLDLGALDNGRYHVWITDADGRATSTSVVIVH